MVENKYKNRYLENDSINKRTINKRPKPAFRQKYSTRPNKEYDSEKRTEKPALQSRRFYKNAKNSTQS
ncbi:unnamed protein product [Cunninghamella echinulata]